MNWEPGKPMWKPSRTARKKKEHKAKVKVQTHEDVQKREVRKRDRHRCRFPLCGCGKLRLRLEVGHLTHKGMGGNPTGDRSTADRMILFCVHRHQDGRVSLHKGTLAVVPLTPAGTDGPCKFLVDADTLYPGMYRALPKAGRWAELARERAVGELETLLLTDKQRATLEQLAELDL